MTDEETREVVVRSESKAEGVEFTGRGVVLSNLDEAWRFSTLISKSDDMCPSAFRGKPEAVLAALQRGAELGLNPMQALTSIAVIKGTPTLSGDTLLALMNQPGVMKKGKRTKLGFRTRDDGQMEGWIRSWREGDDEPIETVFEQSEAETMGLWGRKSRDGKPTPWITMPGIMLQWRCVAKHSRRYYSDVTKGLYMTEEIGSIQRQAADQAPARDITPPRGVRTGRADPLFGGGTDDSAAPEEEGEIEDDETLEGELVLEVDPETGEVIPEEAGIEFEEEADDDS